MISFTDSAIIILYIHCEIIKEILKSSNTYVYNYYKKKNSFEKEIKININKNSFSSYSI